MFGKNTQELLSKSIQLNVVNERRASFGKKYPPHSTFKEGRRVTINRQSPHYYIKRGGWRNRSLTSEGGFLPKNRLRSPASLPLDGFA
ncbi:hypothetical protein AVEN_125003-1 [Araneus ventricosus]|uniref:Uncharacterized protein n=1 Tax=Araneus ventricosus TaxID=182803 RepID=A0A4Y2EEK5_ARAVE|nr:hypothetical protein AVEN_125003-1 [Araneus ventricosus]